MKKSLNIIITGDTHLGGGRVRDLALRSDTEALFGDFLSEIQNADLAITNLESPVTERGKPILKTGPHLKSVAGTLPVLKKAGFDLLTLANNHIMDYGKEGLEDTLAECKLSMFSTVGAGLNVREASKPFTINIKGFKIAVINISENEFSTTQNGEPGAYGMDPVDNFNLISRTKKNADKVLVVVHGGHEHFDLPSPRMKKTYRFYVDSGADAVIGHHTHCLSGSEIYKGAPILYSLGNFLFDRNDSSNEVSSWNRGVMLKLILSSSEDIKFELLPFIQGAEHPGLRSLSEQELEKYNEDIRRINEIIEDDGLLAKKFEEYCKNSGRLYNSYLEPHSVRIVHALRNRNLLPSLLSDRKKRLYLNLIRCEAHRDIIIKTLQS